MADLTQIINSAEQILSDPRLVQLSQSAQSGEGYTPIPQIPASGAQVAPDATQPPVQQTQAIQQPPMAPAAPTPPAAPISLEEQLASAGIAIAPPRSQTTSESGSQTIPASEDIISSLADAGITVAPPRTSQTQTPTETQPADVPQDTNILDQLGSGINEGIAGLAGAPVDIITLLLNAGAGGINAALGTEIPQITSPVGGSQSIEESILDPFISDTGPQSTAQTYARRIGRGLGSSILPVGMVARTGGLTGRAAGNILATELGAEVGGQVARDQLGDNIYSELLGTVLGGLAPSSALRTSQALHNVIRRAADVGDARDIKSIQRVVQRLSKGSPSNISERSIINAIAEEENLARYLSDNIDSTTDIAAIINRGAGRSPNTLRALNEDIAQPSIRRTDLELAEARTDAGEAVNRALADIPPSQVAPLAKALSEGPAGNTFRDLYLSKIEGYLQADTDMVRNVAGYPAGRNPVVIFDDATGVPYVVRWNSQANQPSVPQAGGTGPQGYNPRDLVPASRFPTVDENAAQALRDVRADLERVVTPEMREGSQRSQNLASETTGALQSDIRSGLAELSPEYAQENALFRSIIEAQNTLAQSTAGRSASAVEDLQRRIERLNPTDPLRSVINEPAITEAARERDILSMLGQSYNPRLASSGTEDLERIAKDSILTLATGNKFAAANTGRDLFRWMRRHGIEGVPRAKELSDTRVLEHMIRLNNDDLDRIFRELRDKMDAAEYDRFIRDMTIGLGLGQDALQEQSTLDELGAR